MTIASKRLKEALLEGRALTVRPAGLRLQRTGENDFRVTIVDEDGYELAEICQTQIYKGAYTEIMNISRCFQFTVS